MSKYDGGSPGNRESGDLAGQAAEHFPRADLKAYMDGELAVARRFVVRRHLARCADCREEVRWLKRLGEDMRDLERAVPRPELRARILASLPETPPVRMAAQNAPSEPISLHRGALRPAFGVAAVVFILGGAFAFMHFSAHTTGTATAGVTTSPRSLVSKTPALVGNAPPPVTARRRTTADTPMTTAPWDTAPSTYHDLISRQAQQMYLAGKAADEKEAIRLRALQQEQDRLETKRRLAALRPETKTPVQLALAVNDMAAARASLAEWTHRMGGSLSAPEMPTASKANKTPAVPDVPVRASDHPTDRPVVLAMRLPAARVNTLADALGHIGTVSRLPADISGPMGRNEHLAAKLMQPIRAQVGEMPAASAVDPKNNMKMQKSVSALPRDAAASPRGNAPDQHAKEHGPFVTILIRLQQAGAP